MKSQLVACAMEAMGIPSEASGPVPAAMLYVAAGLAKRGIDMGVAAPEGSRLLEFVSRPGGLEQVRSMLEVLQQAAKEVGPHGVVVL
jgi:hypothetical protein